MTARRHRPSRPLRRQPPERKPKQRILVVCEGSVTERQYIHALRRHARNRAIRVDVAGGAGAPLTVVEVAVRRRSEGDKEARRERDGARWDQVWCMFDVDEHPRLDEARALAQANGIRLAVSNPCVELWALLHFREHHAHIERGKLRALLQEHMPRYDKAFDFAKMHPGYGEAKRRAEQLDREAEDAGAPGRNPTTGVYALTRVILEE